MSQATNLPHIIARLFNTPLLVMPESLEVALNILEKRLFYDGPKFEKPLASSGRKSYRQSGKTAIVPVYGSLVHRSSGMDAESGLTSYSSIRSQLRSAINDAEVQRILLEIDSPGGEGSGVQELARDIRAMSARKPIWAHVNDLAGSAAYAIAAAANHIVGSETAKVGSIGVYALHLDQSGQDKRLGQTYTFIHAGKYKVDGNPHEPLTDTARAEIQAFVDQMYEAFTSQVAQMRGMKQEAVKATEARTYTAKSALELGLIDEIGDLGSTLEAFGSSAARPAGNQSSRSTHYLGGRRMDEDIDNTQLAAREKAILDREAKIQEAERKAAEREAALRAKLVDVDLRALQNARQRALRTGEADRNALLKAAEAGPDTYDAVLASLSASTAKPGDNADLTEDRLEVGSLQLITNPEGNTDQANLSAQVAAQLEQYGYTIKQPNSR